MSQNIKIDPYGFTRTVGWGSVPDEYKHESEKEQKKTSSEKSER